MKRSTVLGGLTIGLVLGLAVWSVSVERSLPPPPKEATEPAAAPAPTSEPAPAPTPASAQVAPVAPGARTGRFDTNDDGTPVEPLPSSAPDRVRLGVALFTYSGAQGVPPGHRTAAAALEQARAAIAASGGDFTKVLAKADPGSRDDAGWIRRGILERRVEREIFLLAKGSTTREPVDTPRGYWVVLRTQ
ncbi:MAG TPA: hypothetical protein VLC09_00010 [Polyangiaceae bacterium]|nr:hypothetical protein [Polyangiaceae bacterium]